MDGQTGGWADRRMDGWQRMNGRTDRPTERPTNAPPDLSTDKLATRQTDPPMNEWMDGQTEGRTDSDIKDEGYWFHFERGIGGYWRVLGGIGGQLQTKTPKSLLNSPRKPSPQKNAMKFVPYFLSILIGFRLL